MYNHRDYFSGGDEEMITSILVFLLSVFIASVSQVILKSSANQTHTSLIKEYLNVKVIVAYGMFFSSTILTIIAYKHIPLSLGPVLEGSSYIYISILSYLFFKEKLSKYQIIGLCLIIIGIVICYIP